jgi:uncharacterized protein (DUF433 family)
VTGAGVGASLALSTLTREDLLFRITVDPNVCSGKPCLRGHRIWVSLILDLLASGSTMNEILADYPGLEEADVRACIAYGAEMSRERFVDVPAKKIA